MNLAENPWPAVILALVFAILFLLRGSSTGLMKHWLIAGFFLLIAGSVYLYELSVITPAEEVELQVQQLLQNCIDNNREQVVEAISNGQLGLKAMAMAGLSLADIHDDFHLSDLSVAMAGENSRAVSHFRGNGTVSVSSLSQSSHVATRWELTWQKENDAWRIINIRRLDPITGEEMQVLKRAER